MNRSEEFYNKNVELARPITAKFIKTMNHKTLEDVEEIVNRLKEEGYDETPENWYVDGEELLNELKIVKL